MKIKLLLAMFLTTACALAQPSIEWQKCLGGSGSEMFKDIQITSDGGYIVAGESDSSNGNVSGNHGEGDFWVVKLDASGNIEWQKSFGGTHDDGAAAVKQTADGGYIVAGYVESPDGDVSGLHGNSTDGWLIKLNSSGALQWQKCLGDIRYDYIKDISQTPDGGYILGGNTTNAAFNADAWVVKTDALGAIVWQKTFGGSSYEGVNNIEQTTDGGYVFSADTTSNNGDVTLNHGQQDVWIVKLNSTGDLQWQKSLGGSGGEYGSMVKQTADGGYIMSTCTGSTDGDINVAHHGSKDFWVVKLTTNGAIDWQKCLGGSFDDFAIAIIQTLDMGYLVGGYALSVNGDLSSNYGNYDGALFKLSANGNLQWHKSIGGGGGDMIGKIFQTADGGAIIGSGTSSADHDVMGNHGGSSDFWVVKLDNILASQNFTVSAQPLVIYPNPVTQELNVRISKDGIGTPFIIYDLSGKQWQNGKLKAENTVIEIGNLPKGLYLFSTQGFTHKFEKQ